MPQITPLTSRNYLRKLDKLSSLAMLGMTMAPLFALLPAMLAQKADGKPEAVLIVDLDVATQHELKPHRDNIATAGITQGFHQLHLTLTVSPGGDVLHADATGNPEDDKFWLQVQSEVYQWKFKPFEKDGKPVTAEVEEYVNLVPPERWAPIPQSR